MLRAEELMVGDYLTFRDALKDNNLVTVKVVAINGATNELLASIDGDPTLDRIDIDDELCGIPITPEILKKNGFTYYGESWYIPHDDKNKRESVMVGFHMYCTVINITKGNNAYYKEVPCKYRCCAENRHVYVHELQHCLKLCGINKTIEL